MNRQFNFSKISYLSLRDLALLLLPVLMTSVLLAFYFGVLSHHLNKKGIKALEKKDTYSALQYFSRALEEKHLNPWIHLNVAVAYDFNTEPQKALKIYQTVSSQFQSLPQFFSYFNQAELNGRLGFIDKALHNYQQALEFKFKQPEIKKNIELLFQKKENQKNKKGKESQDKNQKGNTGFGKEENENQKKEKNDLEKKSKRQQNKFPKDLSEEQEKFILKAIEEQEGKIRGKTFKKKGQFGDKTGKDW